MNILVVNDDGYNKERIKLLADAFKHYGDVYIVAPHFEQSGASSSITVHRGIKVHEHGNNVWSVEGTPSDCVKYALFGLNLNVDLVVSGINNGANIGIDTIYSGTVGASMEALMSGKVSLAFSGDYNHNVSSGDLEEVIKYIFDKDILSSDYILNINFPKNTFEKSKGIKVTNLGIRPFKHYYEQKEAQTFLKRDFLPFKFEENTDLWAFENGYTSITPLKLGNGDITITNLIRNKVK